MYDFVIFTDVTDTVLAYKAIGAYKCAYILRENGYTVLVVDHLHTFNQEEFQKVIDKSVGTNTKFDKMFIPATNNIIIGAFILPRSNKTIK